MNTDVLIAELFNNPVIWSVSTIMCLIALFPWWNIEDRAFSITLSIATLANFGMLCYTLILKYVVE